MKPRKSLTLVELLISIFIISVLATIAGVYYTKWLVISRNSSRIGLIRDLQKDLGLSFSDKGYYPWPDKSVWLWSGSNYVCKLWVIGSTVVDSLETVTSVPHDPFDKRLVPYLVCDFWWGGYISEVATFLESLEHQVETRDLKWRYPYFSRIVTKHRKVGDIAYPLIMIYQTKDLVTSDLFGNSGHIYTDIYDYTKVYIPPFSIGGGIKLWGEEYKLLKSIDFIEGNLVDINGLIPSDLVQLTPELLQ